MRVAVARDDEHFASVAWHRAAPSARDRVAGLLPLNVTGFRVTMPGKRGNNAGKRQETNRRIPGVFTFIPCSRLVDASPRDQVGSSVCTPCVCVCVRERRTRSSSLFLSSLVKKSSAWQRRANSGQTGAHANRMFCRECFQYAAPTESQEKPRLIARRVGPFRAQRR